MKTAKFIYSIGIVLSFSLCALSAQRSIGLKTGFGLSGFHGEDAEDLNPNWSYVVGAAYEHALNPVFVIRPEIGFMTKGSTFEGIGGSIDLSYLDIPVSLKIVPMPDGAIRPFILAGPVFGFRLAAEMDGMWGYGSGADERIDIKDDTKTFDLGFGMGAGLGIPAGPGTLNLDFRYTLGLLNVATEQDGYQPENKNYQFGLSVGYLYDM